jgi:Excalibur calcium-binding domain
MSRTRTIATAIAGLLALQATIAGTPVHKCVVNGSITFQQDPCPSGQVREAPTLEKLNREQKKRDEVGGVGQTNKSKPVAGVQNPVNPPQSAVRTEVDGTLADAANQSRGKFSCDKRKYCSQMTSCTEAKFFLENCPGVKMDGDRNGIPCEKQWCNR